MRICLIIFLGLIYIAEIEAQDSTKSDQTQNLFELSFNIGIGGSYTDKSFLISPAISTDINIRLSDNCFIQFAPGYTYLIKWNEHYLTLPIRFGVNINHKLSIAAGPSLSYDIGYFKDFGLSAAIYYHINERSALSFSAFSFTLYDYNIDYLYIPVTISYNHMLFN